MVSGKNEGAGGNVPCFVTFKERGKGKGDFVLTDK